jgi:hypothetical protein
MNVFLLDLWHDLREKRLWPVAVVLLLGLVAVPVLLAKPAEAPGPAPVAAVSADDAKREQLAALAKVKLGEEEVGKGSTLGVFDPSNPFSPPKGAMKKEGADADAGTGGGGGGGGAGKSSGTPAAVGTPDDGSTTDGGTTGGGTTPDTGGGGGGGTSEPGGGTTTTVYKYVVDVTFTANGRTRRIKGLEKLDMLPSASSPLLIFMGVTAKGADAVFMVDSTLEAAGEGRCKPSESECAFAYIGAGSEYVFTEEDGDTYTVEIDEIRKVKVTDNATSAKGAKGRASVGPHRRFVPPVMADLVVVATDRLDDSSNDHESR